MPLSGFSDTPKGEPRHYWQKRGSIMSLEYVMQAVTLIFVMALTFAAMLVWAKFKKRRR